ncbi:hypothetical protein VKS41_005232 [Umbelopsis sp. WA50703]
MKFGLNTSMKKTKPPAIKPKAFGQDDDEDDNIVGKETKDSHKTRINKQLAGYPSASTKKIEEEHKKALEEDPNIFDYDAVYDNLKTAEKLQQDKLKSKENKKARYVEGLLEMAELRKRDRLRADEKKVEREREEEGDLYGDKEAFVTSSYKEQKEELRRLEEEEKKKEAQESKKKNFNGFYRQLLDEQELAHAAIVEASIKGVTAPPEPNVEVEDEEDTTLAQQALQEGKDVMLNDDNVIVDKRQLLGAGLNVAKKPKFGTFMSLSDSDPRVQQRQQEYEEYKRKKLAESAAKRSGRGGETERERMSREVERQMLERKQQEEEEEKKKEEEFKQKLQKRTSDETAMSAKERYLARKRQKAGAQS